MDAEARTEFARDLEAYQRLCEEVMALTTRENQALTADCGYAPFEFYQNRKNLLPRLEESLMALRKWRHRWQQASPAERADCPDVKALFQSVQSLLMKVLLLDRENQQALLRHGLVPARQLPSTAVQQPHCVADVYRRHARS
ncbi:MAG TPA: hypothetical protein VKY92_07310 [Verrucomicrobiae bacterium]|jgi:hypothetical protein|nr:hypothetical protein [Verrucomicrobiae bacterium]